MQFEGSNAQPQIRGVDLLPGKVNQLTGRNRAQWHTDIPTYQRVRYERLYPGIDLEYYGHGANVEYDFLVGPGADPNAIRLRFMGADRMEMDTQGDLMLHSGPGELRHKQPVLYQELAGVRSPVEGRFILLNDREVGFAVGTYDHSRSLVIDPSATPVASTYLGGDGTSDPENAEEEEAGRGVAVNSTGV